MRVCTKYAPVRSTLAAWLSVDKDKDEGKIDEHRKVTWPYVPHTCDLTMCVVVEPNERHSTTMSALVHRDGLEES